MTVPDRLTLSRVLLIPFVVGASLAGHGPLAALLFAVAAATDWLDGWLARRWNQTTAFGAFLDPVADKLMVVAVLVVLASGPLRGAVLLPALAIILREVGVSALREWLASIGQRDVVAVSRLGKFKTAAQMSALTLMLLGPAWAFRPFVIAGVVLLWVAAVLALWSGAAYLRAAWPLLRPEPE